MMDWIKNDAHSRVTKPDNSCARDSQIQQQLTASAVKSTLTFMRYFFMTLLLGCLFGCATTRSPAPTLDQIIALHQSGESADKIKVIDFLRETEIDEARRQERLYSDWPWGWPRFHIWIQR
jgi:hypothetical protein